MAAPLAHTPQADPPAQQPPQPQPVQAHPNVTPVKKVTLGNIPHLHGSFSIKSPGINAPAPQTAAPQQAAEPLTQERLEQYWAQMIEAKRDKLPRAIAALDDVKIQLEGKDVIVLNTPSSYLDITIKPYAVEILEYLRQRSGVSSLNYRVNLIVENKSPIPYTPFEKYDAMVEINPTLAELRKILPEIDY